VAYTYSYADAWNYIAPQVRRHAEDTQAATIANVATSEIWKRYPWKEYMAELPSFFLVGEQQDYGAPIVAVPSDFHGLYKAYLIHLTESPRYWSIKILRDRELTSPNFLPHAISYNRAKRSFRMYPRPAAGVSNCEYLVTGEYKRNPTLVTPGTLQTTLLPWEDHHFQNFCTVLRWAVISQGSPTNGLMYERGEYRMGGVQAEAMAAIEQMAADEGLLLGDGVIAPAEPLFAFDTGGNTWPLPYL